MRTLAWFLILLGLVLLLKEFNPTFVYLLRPYAPLIKGSFWGVTLIAFGLYLLAKKGLRKAIIALYILYLTLYLVV